ncbi:hypothetical protein H632_c1321p1 [Helicosporidium sp. ATCC 50920]|nr:hypothetical protein H632_c1321p1 [Helicosporidium sp. ATCC 50920]|eukprot:KDD74429.1 hypothetical protein H632_c1321p1 [Helicosporidium sp. ATCC 50920]
MFASAGVAVEVWDHERSHSVQSMPWGSDGITSVRFNPAETELLAASTSDRGVALYDLRTGTALRKLVMQTKANRVSWNPQMPFTFVVANDDACLYTYDMRRLSAAKCVHEDFVSAVTDVDFSPTGREFVAGGYDRTLRIFAVDGGHSRDVYHTKRQQRVAAVAFSGDGSYVFSGSDDMNLRVWKAEASAPQGIVMPRERRHLDYAAALVERHKHLPEVRRIHRARHLPKAVLRAQQLRRVQIDAEAKKTRNRVAQSGGKKPKPARQRKVVAELQ